MEPVTLSIADACKALGIQRTKINQLLSEGRLDSMLIGRKRLITTASIKRLVENATQHKAA